MRRRTSDSDAAGVPPELLRFDPADWPDRCHPECAFWEARTAWLGAGNSLPGPAVDGPDAPFHPETL